MYKEVKISIDTVMKRINTSIIRSVEASISDVVSTIMQRFDDEIANTPDPRDDNPVSNCREEFESFVKNSISSTLTSYVSSKKAGVAFTTNITDKLKEDLGENTLKCVALVGRYMYGIPDTYYIIHPGNSYKIGISASYFEGGRSGGSMLIPVVEGFKYPQLSQDDIWINSRRPPVPHLLDVDSDSVLQNIKTSIKNSVKGV